MDNSSTYKITQPQLTNLDVKARREGIIVYERTSHSSNIKRWSPIGLWPIHFNEMDLH